MVTVKPSELLELLRFAIRRREPALVVGPPGVGKTEIAKEAAQLESADLLVSHPAVEDPTEQKGIPWVVGGERALFLPLTAVRRAMAASNLLVWLLDDLGQAPPLVQASYMQFLLGRQCGDHRLSEQTTFIACTNSRTHKSGVTTFLEAVKNRFTGGIYHLRSDHPDWDTFARRRQLHVDVIAFLRFRPNLLNQFEPSQDIVNFPCERSWEAVSRAIQAEPSPSVELPLIAGIIGEGATGEFLAYRRMAHDLPTVTEILEAPDKVKIPKEPSALYATTTALGMACTTENFGQIWTYVQRLYDAKPKNLVEFASLLCMDCFRTCQAIHNTAAFRQLEKHPVGAFLVGAVVVK